jgi:alkylation response protein AidB-like acyl-CoA dehydrogenase
MFSGSHTNSRPVNLPGAYILQLARLLSLSRHLSRQIAFLKSYATSTGQETARDAVQVFGGRGITKTGMGRFVEHVSNDILRTITLLA